VDPLHAGILSALKLKDELHETHCTVLVYD